MNFKVKTDEFRYRRDERLGFLMGNEADLREPTAEEIKMAESEAWEDIRAIEATGKY